MRYIEQFNILVTASYYINRIQILSVPDFKELNEDSTKYEYGILRLEIISQSNDNAQILSADKGGCINIWNVNKKNETEFSIDLITSF